MCVRRACACVRKSAVQVGGLTTVSTEHQEPLKNMLPLRSIRCCCNHASHCFVSCHHPRRLDHVNLTALLAQLKRVARAAEEEAVAEATGGSSSSSSNSSSSGSSAVTAAAAAAAARAVRVRVAELAAVAARLVRRRAKW